MQYELHVTVSTSDIEQFKSDCQALGVKPIVIEVQLANIHSQQVMTSSKHTGDDYQPTLRSLSLRLKKRGYKVLREKVEIFPEAEKHVDFIYYETHMRLKLKKDMNRQLLEDKCNIFNFHLSKNLVKVTTDFDYQMITYRTRYFNLKEFIHLIDFMKKELVTIGIEYDKVEIEECILDSNVAIDEEWLKI